VVGLSQVRSREARKRWRLGVLALLLVFVAFAVLYGPDVIEHTSIPVLDKATLSDGSELGLLCVTKRRWLQVRHRSLLLCCNGPAAGSLDRTPSALVTKRGDRSYQIMTTPGMLRAWVVGVQTGEVVFSVDYENGKWWPANEQQPEWAVP